MTQQKVIFLRRFFPGPALARSELPRTAIPVHGGGCVTDFLNAEPPCLEPRWEPPDGRASAEVQQQRHRRVVDQRAVGVWKHATEVLHSGVQPIRMSPLEFIIAVVCICPVADEVQQIMVLLGKVKHRPRQPNFKLRRRFSP